MTGWNPHRSATDPMRILLQRVTCGSVTVDDAVIGAIGQGLVLLVGIGHGDTQPIADKMAQKAAQLRIFNDEQGKFNRSLLDVAGQAMVISQFTLYADASRGRRPSFTEAAAPELAEPLCNYFAQALRQQGVSHVATGQFGAKMHVEIYNDGPVTVWLDSNTL